MQHAISLRGLADDLEFVEDTIRSEGIALRLVRWREAHGERAAIVDLRSAAGTLRAYASLVESRDRLAKMRAAKAAKTAQQAISSQAETTESQ